jgi:hypothetical protein
LPFRFWALVAIASADMLSELKIDRFYFFPSPCRGSMSRLIVKNLPTYVTPQHLRAHFSQAGGPGGTITDVQVPLRPDGSSRRFGFVGYKAESEAKSARDWFDRTYVGSTRIDVAVIEVCAPLGIALVAY